MAKTISPAERAALTKKVKSLVRVLVQINALKKEEKKLRDAVKSEMTMYSVDKHETEDGYVLLEEKLKRTFNVDELRKILDEEDFKNVTKILVDAKKFDRVDLHHRYTGVDKAIKTSVATALDVFPAAKGS